MCEGAGLGVLFCFPLKVLCGRALKVSVSSPCTLLPVVVLGPCPQSVLTELSCHCPPAGWDVSGGSSAGINKEVLCNPVRNWSQYWLFSTWLLWSFLIGQELSWHLNVTASSTGRNSNCSHIFFCSPFLLSCTHPRPLPLSGGLKWWWLKVCPARKWLASLSNQQHLNSFLPCIFSWKWKITANRAYLLKAVKIFLTLPFKYSCLCVLEGYHCICGWNNIFKSISSCSCGCLGSW